VPVCGDASLVGVEDCDDGALFPGDGCSSACMTELGYECLDVGLPCTAICGDGFLTGSHTCDDANTSPLDGCDAVCSVEPPYLCLGEPSACVLCGDGVVEIGACDDGNLVPDEG
jgi:cysteine-rich repeat protein